MEKWTHSWVIVQETGPRLGYHLEKQIQIGVIA